MLREAAEFPDIIDLLKVERGNHLAAIPVGKTHRITAHEAVMEWAWAFCEAEIKANAWTEGESDEAYFDHLADRLRNVMPLGPEIPALLEIEFYVTAAALVRAEDAPSAAKPRRRTGKRMTPAQADAIARKLLKMNPSRIRGKSLRQWAEAIGCHPRTVEKTEAWQQFGGRSLGPAAVRSITDDVLASLEDVASLEDADEETEALISEHYQDQRAEDRGVCHRRL